MSRNRNNHRSRDNQNPTPTSVIKDNKTKQPAKDSFTNSLARMGAGTSNLMNASEYPITRITRNYNLMNSLYRNSWIAKKVINVIPEDMCKNWFSLSAELEPEAQDRFDKLQRKTKIKEKILEGLYWGRLYGGAAALILIDGMEEDLDQPLVIDDIMPNSFKGLLILDRWSGIYPSNELISDLNDPDFGMPEYYDVKESLGGSVSTKVHHSRLIRFTGRILPFYEDQAELNWGASELEHVFEELVKRDNTSFNIASLIFQANLLVDQVEGLDQLLTLSDPAAQEDFYNVKKAQNEMRNNSAMMMVGKDENITALQYTFAGLSDVYNAFMLDISGACDIPVTRLFGRSPGGLGSTGEGEEDQYYDMIGAQQNSVLTPKLDQLLPIMFMSEFGKVPKDLGVKYNPVKTPNDSDMATLVKNKVDSIVAAYSAGIITPKIAMKELHELSYTSNMFSNITDEDIEKAGEELTDEQEIEPKFDDDEKDPLNPADPVRPDIKPNLSAAGSPKAALKQPNKVGEKVNANGMGKESTSGEQLQNKPNESKQTNNAKNKASNNSK